MYICTMIYKYREGGDFDKRIYDNLFPELEEPIGVDSWTYKITRFKVFEVDLALRWSGRS